MALTGTSRGQGTHNTAALSFTLSPASNFAAGALAVLCIAVDNADTNGAGHSTFTVTDSLGNTWTRRSSPLYDPGAAAAGVEGAIFTSPQNVGTLQTGTVITVTFDINTTAKCWTLQEVVGSIGTPTFKTQGVGTGSATASPTVTSSSIPNGQMIIGALFNEQGTGQTVTGDSDTTNGSWSTQQTAEVGSTASGMTISSQQKVVTATATQTYNPTLGTSSDVILAWISIGEDITVAPGLGQPVFEGFAPSIDVSAGTVVAVGLGAATFSGFAPTIQLAQNVNVGLGEGSFTGFAPVIALGQNINIGVGQSVFTGFEPTIQLSDNKIVSPGLGQSLFTGFAPAIELSKVVNVGLGQPVFSGFAPSVQITEHKIVSIGLAELVFTGFEPSVSVSNSANVGLAEVIFTGFAPNINAGVPVVVDVDLGQVTIAGFAPDINVALLLRRTIKLTSGRIETVLKGESGQTHIKEVRPATFKIINTLVPNTQIDAL